MPCEMSPLTFFHVQELNADIVKKLPGEGVEYLSADSVEDDVNGLYSAEYLQGITPSGRWLLDVVKYLLRDPAIFCERGGIFFSLHFLV